MIKASQIIFIFVAWFAITIAMLAQNSWKQKDVPEENRKGSSIAPIPLPLGPIVFATPMVFLNADSILFKILFYIHCIVFLWSVMYVVFINHKLKRH